MSDNYKQGNKDAQENVQRMNSSSKKTNYSISQADEELMKKYDISKDMIIFIKKKHGSVEQFRKDYINAMINQNVKKVISLKILNNVNLVRGFDVSRPDWILRYKDLADCIYKSESIFNNYAGLKEYCEKILKQCSFYKSDIKAISAFYGLNGEKKIFKSQIEKLNYATAPYFEEILLKYKKNLTKNDSYRNTGFHSYDMDFDLEQKIVAEYFKKYDIFQPKEICPMDENFKLKLKKMIDDGVELSQERMWKTAEVISHMPNEYKKKILKARFGDSIIKSDIRRINPQSKAYKNIFKNSECVDIDDKLLKNKYIDRLYDECLSVQLTKNYIILRLIYDRIDIISYFGEEDTKNSIQMYINRWTELSESEANKLEIVMNKGLHRAMVYGITNEIKSLKPSIKLKDPKDVKIEELGISKQVCKYLHNFGINTAQDFIGINGFGIGLSEDSETYKEIKEKLQEVGIMPIFGKFEKFADDRDILDYLDKDVLRLDKNIINSSVLDDEEKNLYRRALYERFHKVRLQEEKLRVPTRKEKKRIECEILEMAKKEEQKNKEAEKNDVQDSEEKEKADLIKIILDQQETIKDQIEEIRKMIEKDKKYLY